mmetsp:Transcript_1431/g.1607  ORF Transcript_1431/g.1607 Transcript_1431/m.1607 type:complete len:313 (-) Transcript_1431:55-993(-)
MSEAGNLKITIKLNGSQNKQEDAQTSDPMDVDKKKADTTPPIKKDPMQVEPTVIKKEQKQAKPKRNKRTKKSDDNLYTPTDGFQQGFWKQIQPYFSDYTEDDITFCAPKPIDDTDEEWRIPPLGASGFEHAWGSDDIMNDAPSHGPVKVEVFTERVLACLLQDPSAAAKNDKQSVTVKHDPSTLLALPLDKPPVASYSHSIILDIEERMKFELRTLGLLEDVQSTEMVKEDDEICRELRQLQTRLKAQIEQNNDLRSKLVSLVKVRKTEQEEFRAKKESYDQDTIRILRRLKQIQKETNDKKKAKAAAKPAT